MRHFQAKISKIFWGGGTAPSPDPTPLGEGNTPDQTAHPRYIFVHLLFLFFFGGGGICTYKSSHGKTLIWPGKVMEIDFSKVVTMVSSHHFRFYETLP